MSLLLLNSLSWSPLFLSQLSLTEDWLDDRTQLAEIVAIRDDRPAALDQPVSPSSLTYTVALPNLSQIPNNFSIDPTIGDTDSVAVHAIPVSVKPGSSSSSVQSGATSILCVSDVYLFLIFYLIIDVIRAILIFYLILHSCIRVPFVVTQKRNLSGPIAGGVIGALLVMLAAGGLCAYRARRLSQSSERLSVTNPFTQNEGLPAQQYAPVRQETIVSTDRCGPPGSRGAEEKAQQTAHLQREFEALAGHAEAQGPGHSVPPYDGEPRNANALLVEQIRVLENQMSVML
ncbi:hypothetical protein B0H13DRAFT_2490385 [Mycena leptocephala]|nr:hypothetical protein B0H13DRAFT_2490385 [Mycena leptocephala]